jgi:predicted signal transduction protein with EAL and GGDEF domain
MRIAYTLHLVSYTLLSDHAPLLAMSVNALLSSLAIALRVKILTEERDEARQEERIARRLADIDPLTGLLNRRGLLGRARWAGTPAAAGDRCGPLQGDQRRPRP